MLNLTKIVLTIGAWTLTVDPDGNAAMVRHVEAQPVDLVELFWAGSGSGLEPMDVPPSELFPVLASFDVFLERMNVRAAPDATEFVAF